MTEKASTLNGKHQGETVVIGGFSPQVVDVPKELLALGPIIGLNQWATLHRCDYWIALDVFNYPCWKEWLATLDADIIMRNPSDTEVMTYDIPVDAADYWAEETPAGVPAPTQWDGTLKWGPFTFLGAINLAIILGAKEVVLVGVDFVNNNRADGTTYNTPDFWAPHLAEVNKRLAEFAELVPIYKTHPDSPLELPLHKLAFKSAENAENKSTDVNEQDATAEVTDLSENEAEMGIPISDEPKAKKKK